MTSIRGDSGRRDELARLHDEAWRRIAEPGTWLAGAERCAIVSEVRRAGECALCAERKAALSPFAVDGKHDSGGVLPEGLVDVVHRIATDPGRLSRKWYDAVIAGGVAETHYVEAVGVTVRVVCIDSYCRAIGDPLRPPPEPVAGEPSRERPNAEPGVAWVPMVDLPSRPNVGRALSLAPTENAAMRKLVQAQYVPVDKVRDFRFEPGRSLSRPQIELVAARVSAINECFYWTTAHATLLRASSEHSGGEVDLAAVASGGDSGVPHGEALTRFTEAVVRRTDDVEPARTALAAALGDAAVVEAAAVVGTFQMMDRIADSTGIPLDAPIQMLSRDVREQMGLDAFGSASNTPAAGLLRRAGGRALSSILRTGIRLRGRLRG